MILRVGNLRQTSEVEGGVGVLYLKRPCGVLKLQSRVVDMASLSRGSFQLLELQSLPSSSAARLRDVLHRDPNKRSYRFSARDQLSSSSQALQQENQILDCRHSWILEPFRALILIVSHG